MKTDLLYTPKLLYILLLMGPAAHEYLCVLMVNRQAKVLSGVSHTTMPMVDKPTQGLLQLFIIIMLSITLKYWHNIEFSQLLTQ